MLLQEHHKELEEQLVAVINVDGAVAGNYTLMATASPMLKGTIMNATKSLYPSYPTEEERQQHTTLYEEWANRMPDDEDRSKPRFLFSLFLFWKKSIMYNFHVAFCVLKIVSYYFYHFTE